MGQPREDVRGQMPACKKGEPRNKRATRRYVYILIQFSSKSKEEYHHLGFLFRFLFLKFQLISKWKDTKVLNVTRNILGRDDTKFNTKAFMFQSVVTLTKSYRGNS